MAKRGENIRKRKDGRWEARYKKGVNSAGSPIYGSVYGKTYKEAKSRRQERIKHGEDLYSHSSNILFRDVQKLWVDQNRIRLKPATERKYQYMIDRHILPELGNLRLTQISAPVINSYLANKLKNGRLDGSGPLSPSYVRTITLIINSIMSFAAEEKLCPPLSSRVNKPVATSKELAVLSKTEQRVLVEAISTNPNGTAIGILIALYAGLRIGEICALEWEDEDFLDAIIRVRHTVSRVPDNSSSSNKSKLVIDKPKTASSVRTVPMCSALYEILKEYSCRHKYRYIVSNCSGFVSPRTFEYRYHEILKRSGVKQINFHALRHTFATRCIEADVDIKSLSEILGHSNVSITLSTYVHSSMDLKRRQLEKLAMSCSGSL